MRAMNEFNSQKQAAQYLLAAYCLFILYVCFIPFHFNFDPNFIRWRWEVFLTESVPGRTRASLPDVIGNIFLFVPFGILCVSGARQRALRPVVLILVCCQVETNYPWPRC
jgi:hypothetical protein